ncbi:Rab effector MyRIP [Anabarilius grahami]|uniref:Rab effector MyRIP n=1 Tax=Anabarilius grahami TaxID=495550 RepID=A0A3N0XVA9_ANAGA|nr:Rab effector MyRIP [Anabarilius grahami]
MEQKYSAASLCSITTEVLKVLNATEELLGEAEGKVHDPSPAGTPMSSGPGTRKLDQHLTKMEENVYLAAGAVYSLEGALSDLEDCARSISSSTTETELAFLEDQVATAAAQVQQSELQISDIEARISALKTAGLNVSACTRFSKYKSKPMSQTLDSSRHQRRKLPAPPLRSMSGDFPCLPELRGVQKGMKSHGSRRIYGQKGTARRAVRARGPFLNALSHSGSHAPVRGALIRRDDIKNERHRHSLVPANSEEVIERIQFSHNSQRAHLRAL